MYSNRFRFLSHSNSPANHIPVNTNGIPYNINPQYENWMRIMRSDFSDLHNDNSNFDKKTEYIKNESINFLEKKLEDIKNDIKIENNYFFDQKIKEINNDIKIENTNLYEKKIQDIKNGVKNDSLIFIEKKIQEIKDEINK